MTNFSVKSKLNWRRTMAVDRKAILTAYGWYVVDTPPKLCRTPSGVYHTEDKPPMAWQERCFAKLDSLPYAALLCDVGVGKSAMLLYLITAKYMRGEVDTVVLFAPNSVYRQWNSQQIPQHCPVPWETVVWGERSVKKDVATVEAFANRKIEGLKFLLVNVEAMSHDTYVSLFKTFIMKNKTAVVVDESTRIKNNTAKRSQNIVIGLNICKYLGRRLVDVQTTSVARYILSGTAVSGAPTEAYSQFNFLKMGYFNKPFTAFKQRYSIEKKCTIPGGKIFFRRLNIKDIKEIRTHIQNGCDPAVLAMALNVNVDDIKYIVAHPELTTSWKNLDELRRLIAPCTYIERIEDCREDIPPKQFFTLEVDMTPEQKAAYNSLKSKLYYELGGANMTVTNKLTLVGRLQQITGGFLPLKDMEDPNADPELTAIGSKNPKYDALAEDIEDNDEFPVIIFCRYTAEAEFIQKQLTKHFDGDRRIEMIIGRVPIADREAILADFDKREVDVIVATPGCLSTGRNLDKSHIIYFFSNSYSADEREQALGRIRRITQNFPCIYKDIVCRSSVDVAVIENLQTKGELIEYFRATDLKDVI